MINDSINRFLGVLCYPFVSMDMFRQELIREYIESVKVCEHKAAKQILDRLRSRLIVYIQQNYNIYSYDEIYLYLEKCYLYDAEGYRDELELYQHTVCRMARALISHRDGKIVFKYWKNEEDEKLFGGFAGSNKVTLFHNLSSHIPMDVVAIVYMITNQKCPNINCLDNFYGNIEVADQQLARILETGVAENHLHKGVSRTFPSIWDSLMEPLTAKKGKYFQNMKFVNGTEEQNARVLFHILGCGIVRAYLIFAMTGKGNELLKEDIQDEVLGLVHDFQEGQPFENRFKLEFLHVQYSAKDNEKNIISYFVNLWNGLTKNLPKDVFEGKFCTLVLENDSEIHTLDENIFLYHVLGILLEAETDIQQPVSQKDDQKEVDIKRCIMQYLRVRNYLFHKSVQQKMIKGLDYFQQEHYRVNSALNHANINNFWETALREQLQNRDLCKIEFRTSMPEAYSEFKKDVVHFLKAYHKIITEDYCNNGVPYKRIPQAGLVIHFLKREDETALEKCFHNGKLDCSYFQFGQLQQSYRKQIDAFTQLRSEFTELSKYLVGIDAASLENATPVWVFAPIFEKARDSSIDLIGRSSNDRNYMQSLGFTFHAGEDFRHILSGLRRIDEVVEHLKFHAGDRIGHGIALGLNPQKWREQNPVVILPQLEALENYLWAYDTLSNHYSNFQAAILTFMEKRIYELSRKIYGGDKEGIATELLIDGYRKLFSFKTDIISCDAFVMAERELCRKLADEEPIQWRPELVTAARHCKVFVKKMEKPIHCEITQQDILIIEELQKILKKKLGQKGIVLEVNPSSNTAIADLDILYENQFYQLNQLNDEQNIIVCINSDDPAVFNTNVSNELAYIYYGMLEKGISREAALLWIDRVRKNGLNSSFIHHEESDLALVRNLTELIQRI